MTEFRTIFRILDDHTKNKRHWLLVWRAKNRNKEITKMVDDLNDQIYDILTGY